MPSSNAINTVLLGHSVMAQNLTAGNAWKYIFSMTSGKRNVLTSSKVCFFNKVVELAIFKRPLITPGFSVALIPLFLLENLDTLFYDFSNIPTPYK